MSIRDVKKSNLPIQDTETKKTLRLVIMNILGILIGFIVTSSFLGPLAYLCSNRYELNYGNYIGSFLIFGGPVILFISGLLSCLFVRRKNDVARIIIPNCLYIFCGNLAIMIYYTTQWEWYSSLKGLWSWIVDIIWVVFIIFLIATPIVGGTITGGFKLRPLKRKLHFETINSQNQKMSFFFCTECGTKQFIQNKYCTFCGTEIKKQSDL